MQERLASPSSDLCRPSSELLFLLFGGALERGAEDVAQRRAGIGRAVLGDRLLLLGDFERLDRHRHLVGAAVKLGDPGVHLLADRKALGALLGAVAGEFRALDEGGEIGADEFHLKARFLDLDDLAGHHRALLDVAGLGEGIALELLDTERDALLLDVDIEHLGAHLVALLELVDDLLARPLPVEVGEMDHAVDIAVEAEEQAELGLVLDLALDHGARRIFLDEHFPRIAHGLLEAERDAALDRIDFEHLDLDLLGGRNDLAGMNVLLGPRHFRHVDQALDAWLELDEGAVVGDVGDAAGKARADREFRLDALPRIGLELLHAERDAVRLVIDLDDLDLHLLADIEHFGGMVDAPPGDVGDVEEPVNAAEIDEGAVIGDVLDHAVDDLALFEVLHELLALLCAGLLEHGTTRNDDVAAPAVHLENLERLGHVHQRRHVADRPDIDLAARQERHRAVEIDRKAALDLIEDDALDLFVALERLLELAPAFLAPGLVARQHGLAKRIVDPLEIDLDRVADLDVVLAPRSGELAQRHAALGFQSDIDDRKVLFDPDHGPLDDGPFLQIAVRERILEQRGKILARRRGSGSDSHEISCAAGRRFEHGHTKRLAGGPADLRPLPD